MSKHLVSKAGGAVGSLAGFWLARSLGRETWYPHVVLGGLAGMAIVELYFLQQPNQAKCQAPHSAAR